MYLIYAIVFCFLFFYFQALNGFLMILTCEGEVFFATHSIESYLGFHQVNFTFERFNILSNFFVGSQ
jgi:hypothetical protein